MIKTNSIKTNARIAGFLYFLQIPLGVFGILYVPNALIVKNNLSATISKILANEFLFRLSIVSSILCALITVATAYYIFKVLRLVHATYAKIIVVMTLLVAPITILNEINHIAILLIAKSPEYQKAFSASQVEAMISFLLDLHQHGIYIIDIFFGLWLLPMGYLVIKSGYIPKIIGYLLIVTCVSYLIDFSTSLLFPNFGIILSEYTWLGEVLMVFWLLIKGVKQKEYELKVN